MPRGDAEKQISSSTELPPVPVYENLPKLGDIFPASLDKVRSIFSHNAEVQVVSLQRNELKERPGSAMAVGHFPHLDGSSPPFGSK